MSGINRYCQERGHTLEAVDCYRVSQVSVEHIIDSHPSAEDVEDERRKASFALLAETHNNIAGSETELNNADGALSHFLTYNKMLVEEHRDELAVEDPRLTSSCFNVGLSFTMKGEYQNAIFWLEKALEEAKRLTDPARSKHARSLALINLGLTHWLQGDLQISLDLLETARRERAELLGANDRQSMM